MSLVKIFRLSAVLLFCSNNAFAQFHLNGLATQTNNQCWTLTPDRLGAIGSIWNETKINLNQSFEVSAKVFLGCKDVNGADGIVFGFQPVSTTVGMVGGDIGFGGVSPSLGIEMDTYQNGVNGDPVYDHIAVIKNGRMIHSSTNNLAGPVQLGNGNIEDCTFHDFYVKWNANTHFLQIFWDCTEAITYTGDIVRDVFNNNPLVFWGFTSATGGLSNEQKICLEYTTFLNQLPDTAICKGGKVELKASGGISYQWTPTTGLNDPSLPNPTASPSVTTNYSVVVADACGHTTYDTLTITVGTPIVFDLGRDTSICQGQQLRLSPNVSGATYIWQNRTTSSSFDVTVSGKYSVEIEKNHCSSADSIDVKVIGVPDIHFDPVVTLCYDKKVILHAESDGAEYEWQDHSHLSTYVVLNSGNYSVKVKNVCGTSTASTDIYYNDCYPVYIPNVFSPNGDNQNDVFLVYDNGAIELITDFKVFDRWGDLVFSAQNIAPNNASLGWNGGKNAPGVYAYYVSIRYKDGTEDVKKGDITLVK
jgi:gliding motility-associated-like protein